MKIIGYMLGTDPEVLTQLLLEGYETLPLSNGYDNHGKYITHLTTEDHISLIVGYLHKFLPLASQLAMGDLQLDSVTLDGTVDENGNYELMSKPSEYLDAIWFAQRIANLNDDEMNAAQQIISPLLKDNDGKLPVIHKNGKWYWGPFRITR